ncbi:TPA: site-specific DNA-methyltransferase [Legionella pneumophila]|nr:site-specific DNA-methyltransferase [Legionella pneumophila]HAT9326893.1 site-specific DNA-methyltransferase [Legionella pneumophila subsp. pneumophila]HAT2028506.1 site-specific DNA-methyltransferase [Legionella pneumophila]HAT8308169.1 site-specific DNA-methyltransferase [Legionella pneumophila]HAT8717544.1 site-specific DNA-methyltransferase [Legionella pneumophila]
MPKILDPLTEDELKEIVDFLKKGESLPDEYRFRLFNNCNKSELIWPGKNKNICKAELPFQTIEHIDTPKLNQPHDTRHLKSAWANKLIWGENKLVLSSLQSGSLRHDIEAIGGIKLVYIDPPFDVGADFSMPIEIGDQDSFTKRPSVIEEIAYRDTWGKGVDSYLTMIYERLRLIHNLLADDGSIYIHCDYRLSGVMRLVLDEIFGENNFLNQITWKRSTPTGGKTKSKMFPRDCDVIFSYKKLEESTFNNLYVPYSQDYIDKFFTKKDPDGRKWASQTLGDYSEESIKHFESIGRIFVTKNGSKRLKYYLDEAKGVLVDDVWTDIRNVRQEAVRNIGKKTDNPEYLNYPTQKPEALLERIILASSNPGDLVADFFCGSGTTLAVAEKHARTWIGCDLSRFGIHTSRKRLINTQFELDKKNKPYNAFEILNLGHYDRQYYMGIDPGLPKEKRDSQARLKENEFFNLIHRAYKSQQLHDMAPFHGFKSETDHAVYIGSLDSPVTMSEIDEIIISAPKYGFNKVDVLGFEFEMGLTPDMQDRAKEKNVTLALRYIPRDVFDKRAIEKGQVIFYDVSYVEAKINKIDNTISVQLIDFGVFHRQEDINYISHTLKAGGSKVIVDSGQVIKITKTRTGAIDQEVLTKNWTDWIDYWSVDFDYESLQDKLSGNNIFENQWQNFRTKNNRKILTESECFKYSNPGKYKVAVKVIDIFGHDTTKVFDIDIGLTR